MTPSLAVHALAVTVLLVAIFLAFLFGLGYTLAVCIRSRIAAISSRLGP